VRDGHHDHPGSPRPADTSAAQGAASPLAGTHLVGGPPPSTPRWPLDAPEQGQLAAGPLLVTAGTRSSRVRGCSSGQPAHVVSPVWVTRDHGYRHAHRVGDVPAWAAFGGRRRRRRPADVLQGRRAGGTGPATRNGDGFAGQVGTVCNRIDYHTRLTGRHHASGRRSSPAVRWPRSDARPRSAAEGVIHRMEHTERRSRRSPAWRCRGRSARPDSRFCTPWAPVRRPRGSTPFRSPEGRTMKAVDRRPARSLRAGSTAFRMIDLGDHRTGGCRQHSMILLHGA